MWKCISLSGSPMNNLICGSYFIPFTNISSTWGSKGQTAIVVAADINRNMKHAIKKAQMFVTGPGILMEF